MSSPSLSQYKALVFDVYGTLVDWETGLYTALQSLLASTPRAAGWSKKEALQAFSSVEKDLQAKYPDMLYSDLLAKGHAEFAARLASAPSQPEPSGTTSARVESSSAAPDASTTSAGTSAGTSAPSTDVSSADSAFGQSIAHWPVFPDTVNALAALSKSYKLIVLSNVDRASFAHTRAALEHGFAFDAVVTAQDVGAWKPSPQGHTHVVQMLQDKFGIPKEQVLVVAQSLWHDHQPANALGLASVWIDRAGATIGVDNPETYKYIESFPTLGHMAAAVHAEKC